MQGPSCALSSRRLRRLGHRSLLGWRRSLLGWRRNLLGWRRGLFGRRGLIAACASLLGVRAGGAIVHARERKARLNLIGGESILLLFELMSGEPREKDTLFLLGAAEARLQGIDALLQLGDAGRELPGIGRHALAVALHARPLLALGRGTERGHVTLRLDGAQLICQRDVALLQLLDRT